MMLDLQTLIVVFAVAAAGVYAAMVFIRKSKSFSSKAECSDDCGCSSKAKSPKAAH